MRSSNRVVKNSQTNSGVHRRSEPIFFFFSIIFSLSDSAGSEAALGITESWHYFPHGYTLNSAREFRRSLPLMVNFTSQSPLFQRLDASNCLPNLIISQFSLHLNCEVVSNQILICR